MPTRNVNVSTKENPYGTAEGQDISSVSETMWRRLYRLGRPRSTYGDFSYGTSSSTPSKSVVYDKVTASTKDFTASLGHELLPQKITVSTTTDAVVFINIHTGIFNPYTPVTASVWDNYVVTNHAFIKAGTPFDWYPDGAVSIVRGRTGESNSYSTTGQDMVLEGVIQILAYGATGGQLYYAVNGVEIARGDL